MAARARLGDASEPDGEDEAAAINAAPRSDALELAAMAERPGAAAAISRPPAHSDSQDELWADTPPAGAGARAAFDAVEPDSASERDSATGPRGAPAAGTPSCSGRACRRCTAQGRRAADAGRAGLRRVRCGRSRARESCTAQRRRIEQRGVTLASQHMYT